MPKYAEQRILPHTPEQLYDLVADVDKYPEFLPWCMGARVNSRKDDEILADLIIGFKMFREKFTSRVSLDRKAMRIDVEYMDGPFKYLNNHWVFEPHTDGCKIDFFVDFEFRSIILQKTIGLLFSEAVQRMIAAFETRAKELYK